MTTDTEKTPTHLLFILKSIDRSIAKEDEEKCMSRHSNNLGTIASSSCSRRKDLLQFVESFESEYYRQVLAFQNHYANQNNMDSTPPLPPSQGMASANVPLSANSPTAQNFMYHNIPSGGNHVFSNNVDSQYYPYYSTIPNNLQSLSYNAVPDRSALNQPTHMAPGSSNSSEKRGAFVPSSEPVPVPYPRLSMNSSLSLGQMSTPQYTDISSSVPMPESRRMDPVVMSSAHGVQASQGQLGYPKNRESVQNFPSNQYFELQPGLANPKYAVNYFDKAVYGLSTTSSQQSGPTTSVSMKPLPLPLSRFSSGSQLASDGFDGMGLNVPYPNTGFGVLSNALNGNRTSGVSQREGGNVLFEQPMGDIKPSPSSMADMSNNPFPNASV